MTPTALFAWRVLLYGAHGKSAAAGALGLSHLGYSRYESGDSPIPRYIELASRQLVTDRIDELQNPKRSLRKSTPRRHNSDKELTHEQGTIKT